eukprot:8445428-Prorocentrum_lima.AAC.1
MRSSSTGKKPCNLWASSIVSDRFLCRKLILSGARPSSESLGVLEWRRWGSWWGQQQEAVPAVP